MPHRTITSLRRGPARLPRTAAAGASVALLITGFWAGPVAASDAIPTPADVVSSTTAPADQPVSELAGIDLPVPAVDVTDADPNLASAAREVVVSVVGPDGPELTKLRADSPAAAATLAAAIDSHPGMTAQPNEVIRVTSTPSSTQSMPAVGRPTSAVPVTGAADRPAGTVGTLAAETLGAQEWGLSAVGGEAAWPLTRGSGLIVAVIDTGVDATHPDLVGRVLPQIDLVGDGQTGDPMGHGTHVSGIIAAALDGEGIVGLANQVQVLPVRALDAQGAGDIFTIASGINQAVAAGAAVINLSLGGDTANSVLKAAVGNALRHGVSVVAAVGNSFQDGNPASYPAGYPGVIGVTSISQTGRSSKFANTGKQVDVAAPGEQIMSTVPGGTWEAWDGTSMATPFVSATAALVRAANPRMTPAQVAATITATAVDDSSHNGRDDFFGAGLLRADLAVARAASAPYGLAAPAAKAKATATSGRSKLRVDINPNRGSGYWTFQVQARSAAGTWATLPGSYRTTGAAETRTINFPRGTYRVVVPANNGYLTGASEAVTLKR